MLPRGPLTLEHLFPEPTVRRVRNLEPLPVPQPLPRASPSPCCIPALGGEGRALDRERGWGSRGVFCAATFLIAVKSQNPPRLLGASCAPRPGPGCAGSSGGAPDLEKRVLAAAIVLSPRPGTLAPVTVKLLRGLAAGQGGPWPGVKPSRQPGDAQPRRSRAGGGGVVG